MDQDKIDQLHDKGESLHDEGEYDKAIEVFKEALTHEKRARSFYMKSYCNYELKRYREALEDIDSAIDMYDRDTNYHALKGVLHAELEEYEEAIKCFSKNVELNPVIVNYGNRAIMYKKMGEYNKSIEDYTTMIDLAEDADKSKHYVSRSTVYRVMNRLDRVWEDLERAIELNPDNISTYLDTAELYITTNCYKEGYDFVTKYESKVVGPGSERDILIYLYLKGILYICLNISIDDFFDQIKDYASKGYDLEWNFSHIEDWILESELSVEKKEKIKNISELLKDGK